MGLGSYPEVSISSAREMAEEARVLLAQGLDPIDVRNQKRATAAAEASRKITTFDDVITAYIAAKIDVAEGGFKNPKHRQQWRNTLKTYVSPLIGKVSIADIDTDCVLKVLRQDTGKGAERGQLWYIKTETASRVRGRLEALLSWAAFRGLRPKGSNPALWKGHLDQELAAPGKLKKVRHHPALPYAELPKFMQQLRSRDGVANRALEFAILTGSRSSEVREALWSEIDMKKLVWAIPEERMKAGRAHEVPLTRRMVEILKTLPRREGNPHVFVGDSRLGRLSENALLNTLDYMGRGDLTQHGFRSTLREWAGEMTTHPREVIEHALAHGLKDKAEAAYQRGTLFPKRRVLMSDWSDYCAEACKEVASL
jgi:integrase